MARTSVKLEGEGQAQTTDSQLERATHIEAPILDDADRLPKDLLFGLLSNERRRLALKYLAENGWESNLSDLAEHIASIESGKPEVAITSGERKRVYVGLYQCHLPKLDDANVIDYNQARGTIELRPEAAQLLPYITRDRSNRTKSWYHHLVPASMFGLWPNSE